MKSAVLVLMLLLYFPLPLIGQRLVPPRKYHSDDDDDFQLGSDDDEEESETNTTGSVNRFQEGMLCHYFCVLAGAYLGAPCEDSCSPKLHHVYCNPARKLCECEKNYPVKMGSTRGCSKRKLIMSVVQAY